MWLSVHSWRTKLRNKTKWIKNLLSRMVLNVLTMERLLKKRIKRKVNSSTLHLMSNKFQGVDVHSWVDLKRNETLTWYKKAQASTSLSCQNLITTCHRTKLTFQWWDERRVRNQWVRWDRCLTGTRFTCNTACSSTDRTTRKWEALSVALGSCRMRNWGRRETNTSTREITARHWDIMKGLCPYSGGSSTSKRTAPQRRVSPESPPKSLSSLSRTPYPKTPECTSTWRLSRSRTKTSSKRMISSMTWGPSTKSSSLSILMAMSSCVTERKWKTCLMSIWGSHLCYSSCSICQLHILISIITP